MAPTVENNAILSLLVDGHKTARELYSLSGLNGHTGRELGRLMQAGHIVKAAPDTFKLSGRAVLGLIVDALLQDIGPN